MQRLLASVLAAAAFVTAANAQINISGNIAVSTTLFAGNVYNLQSQIFVLPGATLTIQPGTVIATSDSAAGLTVLPGAQIFAEGTVDAPIIFTSDDDRATWTGGDPKTGTYRQAGVFGGASSSFMNEWGGLAILGDAYISSCRLMTNSPFPSGGNRAQAEGIQSSTPALYGGDDDNDDSGVLSHISLRYGGRVISLNNEQNGLNLCGVGRGTDVEFIEVLNNVDDGIEIYGGTVNVKYFSVWNVGDDSLDIDEGWRGQAQFGLIVQGASGNASQGAGYGDNAIEVDGAEQSDWQPVTTAALYNLTVIGHDEGDGMIAWRDNANLQVRNCIFMDGGERVIRFDNNDGDGCGLGYGHNNTLSWPARWTTPATTTSTINAFTNPAAAYTAQDASGNLIDYRDNLFFNHTASNAYIEANSRGVFSGGGNNANNSIITTSPIKSITRGASLSLGGRTTTPVTFLDPLPVGDALTSVETATDNGFLTAAKFRGAFPPNNNWLEGWSAASIFGLTSNSTRNIYLPEESLAGCTGAPVHYTSGNAGVIPDPTVPATWSAGTVARPTVENIDPVFNLAVFVGGFSEFNFPVFDGTLIPSPDVILPTFGIAGRAWVDVPIPAGLAPGFRLWTQFAVFDSCVPISAGGTFVYSNGQRHTL